MILGLALNSYVTKSEDEQVGAGNRGTDYLTNITNFKVSEMFLDAMYVCTDDTCFDNNSFVIEYNGHYKDDWNQNSVFAANFRWDYSIDSPGLNFGNLDASFENCTKVLIKKRIMNDQFSNWIVIHEQPITRQEDFEIHFVDYTNPADSIIKYMYIPVIGGVERLAVEEEVESTFDGWFICEPNSSYKVILDAGVSSYNFNQSGAVVTALDRKYPFIVHTGKARYFTGTFKGIFYPTETKYATYYEYENGEKVEKKLHAYDANTLQTLESYETITDWADNKNYLYRRQIDNFLTDNQPKILKDFEGKIWLIDVFENISVDCSKHLKAPVHSFNWTEIGDVKSGSDLYDAGFTNSDYDGG